MQQDNCRFCGSLLRENAKFCVSCGRPTDRGALFSTPSPAVAPPMEINHFQWVYFVPVLQLYSVFFLSSLTLRFVSFFSKNPAVEFSFWIMISISVIVYALKDKEEMKKLFSLEGSTLKKLGLIALCGAGTFLFLNLYFSLFSLLKLENARYAENILKYKWPVWSAYLLISVFPGVFEELAFRGFIYGRLKKLFSLREALLIQAACFSIMHLMPTIFISHFVMGLFFGWVREKTNSLLWCMLSHMAWNAWVLSKEL